MKKVISHALLFALPGAGATVPIPEQPTRARILYVHEGDINVLHCPELMDCSIEAPPGEKFIGVNMGDPTRWQDSKNSLPSRFYSIKPGFGGMKTTLHLVTDHDNEYGFIVVTSGNTPPDYTTILKTDDAEISKRIAAPPTVVPREEYEQAKKEASDAITALAAARAETERKVSQAERQVAQNLPPQMRTYLYDREKAKDHPWEITEIFADDSHTYLRRSVRSNDPPSVYAIGANGKPELIVAHYDPDRDIYVTPQRINAGFLSFGGQKKEKRLTFYLPQGA